MPELTTAQLLDFRLNSIRDRFTAADGATAATFLSHYNKARQANFFSDDQLQDMAARLEVDYQEELDGVYDIKYAERVAAGDTEEVSVAAATTQRESALFRLLRAECRQMMMEDPGFVGSVADEKHRTALFDSWRTAIERDRTFVRTRTSSLFASVPLVRF